MEPEERNEEEVMEEETEEETEEVDSMVMDAVKECFAEGGDAYGMDKNAAIDAVVAKLQGMKDGEDMGGLGTGEGPMDLGEPVA